MIKLVGVDFSYTSKFFYSWVRSMKEDYPVDYLSRVKFLMSIYLMN